MSKRKPKIEHLFEVGARVLPKIDSRRGLTAEGRVIQLCDCGCGRCLVEVGSKEKGFRMIIAYREDKLVRVTDA